MAKGVKNGIIHAQPRLIRHDLCITQASKENTDIVFRIIHSIIRMLIIHFSLFLINLDAIKKRFGYLSIQKRGTSEKEDALGTVIIRSRKMSSFRPYFPSEQTEQDHKI